MLDNFSELKIESQNRFLNTVVSFVENIFLAFGFTDKESLVLTLAAEEVFAYVSKNSKKSDITITCSSNKYYMDLTFKCPEAAFNPRAFNISFSIQEDDEDSLSELGILIASRMTDSFNMSKDGSYSIISFQKYHIYDKAIPPKDISLSSSSWKVTTPETEEVKILINLINSENITKKLPFFFQYPQMVADMYEVGDIKAIVVNSDNGAIAGGIFWKTMSLGTVEIFGPFLYTKNNSKDIAVKLVEEVLEKLGKSNFNGIMCRYYNHNFPTNLFEEIGSLGSSKIYFRQLCEDTGTTSWIHSSLQKYLQQQYKQLFLPRNINIVEDIPKPTNDYSVIITDFQHTNSNIIMQPMVFGKDIVDNLKKHLLVFEKEKQYQSIFFQLDLGISKDLYFIPALLECGFKPVSIIPYGKKGDLLILQKMQTIIGDI